MSSNVRPRTKRLERPTPNIKHPIISDNSKQNDLRLKECIQVMNKLQITSTKNNNKLKIKSNSIENNEKQSNKNKISKSNQKDSSDSIELSFIKSEVQNKNQPKSENYSQESLHLNETQEMENRRNVNQIIDTKNSNLEKEESDWSGWQHFNAQLIPCSHCWRTFFPHRLPVHEKCCKGIAVKTSNHRSDSMRTSPIIKYPSLECTSCGRKYRATSLSLHRLKCKIN